MARPLILTSPIMLSSPAMRTAQVLTVVIIPLWVLVAVVGLFLPGFYRDSAPSIPLEHANDLATLLVGVPLLLISLVLVARSSVRGYLLWMGTIGWSAYVGAIDAFSLQFNFLFLAYVAIFGLAIFALILGIGAVDVYVLARSFGRETPTRWVGGCLVVAAILTALLWLSDIVPSVLEGHLPIAIASRGMPVEPSHVLDLGLLLPATILGGILLWRRQSWGYLLGGVCLGLLVPLLAAINLAPTFQIAVGQPVAIGPVASYAIILLFNLGFTWRYLKSIHAPRATGRDETGYPRRNSTE